MILVFRITSLKGTKKGLENNTKRFVKILKLSKRYAYFSKKNRTRYIRLMSSEKDAKLKALQANLRQA